MSTPINSQLISGFIETALNWLTEQVAGKLSSIQPNGQQREFQIGIDLVNMNDEQKHMLGIAIRKELWVVKGEMERGQFMLPNMMAILKNMTDEQKCEWDTYLNRCIAQSQPQIQLNDTLADFIHEQMGNYPWRNDETLENLMISRMASAFSDYDWNDDPIGILGQIEHVVNEELEDDLEDKVKDIFNSRSLVEDYIRENPSSFRDAIESILRDDPSIIRDVIAKDSDIDQTLRNCLRDNPDIIRDYLQSSEGQIVLDEVVGAKMRSVFEALARNI